MCTDNSSGVEIKQPTAQQIAQLCFDKFRALPKTGKPISNEWTVLAGVVQYNSNCGTTNVVALGAGTKSIGESKLCSNGFILNDSHAEVLTRRALLRYLQYEMRKSMTTNEQTKDALFQWQTTNGKFRLNATITFHFFSTQTPCGDACIAAEDDIPAKRARLEEKLDDTVYTGAKLIGNNTDSMAQTLGALRTKPGRGERTLSMCCSDKLARWHVIGVQGALLDALLEQPIYFDTYNFCNSEDNVQNLQRALYTRFLGHEFSSKRYKLNAPKIRVTEKPNFEYEADLVERLQPTPNGLIWTFLPEQLKPYEISVNGKRQGVTKKKLNTAQAALNISKYQLFANFIGLLREQPLLLQHFNLKECPKLEQLTYAQVKALSLDYQNAWSQLKRVYFKQWTQKSSKLLEFSLETVS